MDCESKLMRFCAGVGVDRMWGEDSASSATEGTASGATEDFSVWLGSDPDGGGKPRRRELIRLGGRHTSLPSL